MYDRTPYGYQFIASNRKVQLSVWNQGFDVMEITLEREVPEDVDIMIIADPRDVFSETEEAVLQAYLDRGGNLFFLGEPRRRETQNPMLRKLFGVELTPMLAQNDIRNKALPSNVLFCLPTGEAKRKMYYLNRSNQVMPTAAGVEQVEDKGYDMFPILQTDTLTPCWTELETTDFVDDTIRFNPSIGEISKEFSTVVGLTRMVAGKEQRIIISGDADVFANNEFTAKRGVSNNNTYLLLGGCYWMSYNKAPIDVRRPRAKDNSVCLSVRGYSVIRWGIRWGIPVLVVLGGIFMWVRRKSR